MTSKDFKWKHFAPTIILWYLRWYGSTPLSYANVSDMLAEQGISVYRSISGAEAICLYESIIQCRSCFSQKHPMCTEQKTR